MKKKYFPLTKQQLTIIKFLKNSLVESSFRWQSESDANAPFFIVGAGRCGTTLLRRLLQASPDIHIPPENWAMADWLRQFGSYRNLLSWRELSGLLLNELLLNNQGWFEEIPSELLGQLSSLPSRQRTLADFIDFLYKFHGNGLEAKFHRWGDKTPANIRHMRSILQVFPRAQFIFMQRDPADVVYSWGQTRKYSGDIEQPALRWKQAADIAGEFERERSHQIIEVRYESLVTNPALEMDRLANYLNIHYDPKWLTSTDHFEQLQDAEAVPHLRGSLDQISRTSLGKGRKNLNDAQLRILQKTIVETAVKAGYQSFVVK